MSKSNPLVCQEFSPIRGLVFSASTMVFALTFSVAGVADEGSVPAIITQAAADTDPSQSAKMPTAAEAEPKPVILPGMARAIERSASGNSLNGGINNGLSAVPAGSP